MPHQPAENHIQVTIRSLKKTYFSGAVVSLTSTNNIGEFDILPEHANLISLIKNYIVLNKGLETEQKFIISNGILKVTGNKVEVFLEV